MRGKIVENIKFAPGVLPQDITTDRTSAYYPMTNAARVAAQLTTGTIADTKKATVQLLQAKNATGTGAKALSALVEYVVDNEAGAPAFIQVEATADQMDKDFTHVAVKVTCDNAQAVQGAAVLAFGDLRYRP